MSTNTPRNPRRRIAGERRSAGRPEAPASPPEPQSRAGRKERPERAPRPEKPSRGSTAAAPTAGSGPSWLVVAVLGALALLLVLAAAYLGLGKWDYRDIREADRVQEASRTAPASAERAAATILSFGYQTLDADEKAAERYMTPAYKKKYAASFDKLVRPNAGKVRAKVQAEVKASGVSTADSDRVNVLLYVNQTTTSTANGGEPQLALNRVMLKMVRKDGSWLVDDITSY